MTPFGNSVATELRSAIVPLEIVSIVDYQYLANASRALLKNALFYVVKTPVIEAARDHAITQATNLAEVIHKVGVQTQGISLEVDQARAEAVLAYQALIDAVADAEPTAAGRAMGVGF